MNIAEDRTFDVGDEIPIAITTKTRAGVLADPGSMTVWVQPKGGAIQKYYWNVPGQANSPEITQLSTGTFELLHIITGAKANQVRVFTTGAVQAEEPGYFNVRAPNIVE